MTGSGVRSTTWNIPTSVQSVNLRIQRQSDSFKKGITDSEFEYAKYLNRNDIPFRTQELLCRECDYHGRSMGKRCPRCNTSLRQNTPFLVDFFTTVKGYEGVVEIVGSIHDKDRVRRRDEELRRHCQAMGYSFMIITNREVQELVS